jgi:hypothetical protein
VACRCCGDITHLPALDASAGITTARSSITNPLRSYNGIIALAEPTSVMPCEARRLLRERTVDSGPRAEQGSLFEISCADQSTQRSDSALMNAVFGFAGCSPPHGRGHPD